MPKSNFTFKELSQTRKANGEQCWEIFDSLAPASIDDLVGYKWKGYEIETGHPLNGVLEASNWFGKEFFDENNGHPLLIYASAAKDGKDTFPADAIKLLDNAKVGRDITSNRKDFEAAGPVARLKTLHYRGANTVSMFYDQVSINDTFKKVDDNTFFGVMDNKSIPDIPYFFVLEKFSEAGN